MKPEASSTDTGSAPTPASALDRAVIEQQLGRPMRGDFGVAHRCSCGNPDVLVNPPRLPDGTPFPTTYYLTCPKLTSALSTLESENRMVEYAQQLAKSPELAAQYRAAHQDYLQRREQLAIVPEIDGISAGGMPDRVKCLHALAAHSLAVGAGVNPIGDLAVAEVQQRWRQQGCPARTVAGIDCGTNSIRLLVAEQTPQGWRDLHREMRVIRLGEHLAETGNISELALQRLRAALTEYQQLINTSQALVTRFVATSAARDAGNAEVFTQIVADFLGVTPEIVPGEVEAQLSFVGATASLPTAGNHTRLVVDIGGGSTEFIRGNDRVEQSTSVNIGCVRLTERHQLGDPATPAQLQALWMDIRQALATAQHQVDFHQIDTVVGVAGTVTTVAALALELDSYDPDRIHGVTLATDQVLDVVDMLTAMTLAQRQALPVMHPGRADVIVAGANILAEILRQTKAEWLLVSEHDILDGIVASLD